MFTRTTRSVQRMARIGLRVACAVGLTFTLAGPVLADDRVRYDDNGQPTVVTEDPTATPAWKQRMFTLAMEAKKGNLSAAEAVEYNNILDGIGVAAKGARRLTASSQAATAGTGVTTLAVSSFYLTQHQVAQNETWNCGPAAAAQVIRSWYYDQGLLTTDSALDGHAIGQSWLGRPEYTNANATPHGTDWAHGDMRRALNNWLFGSDPNFYAQREPTSIADLEDYVTYDLYPNEWMLASDMIERKNNASLHYNHHPLDRDIYHWTSIRGFYNSGAAFAFEDPAANSTALNSDWDDVQPYFNMSSTKTYNLMKKNGIDARGIVW